MNTARYLAVLAVSAAMLSAAHPVLAQSGGDSSSAQVQSQEPSAGSRVPGTASQGGAGDSTLEIAPQPGVAPGKPAVQEIPGGSTFRPGEDTSSVNRDFTPGKETGDSMRDRGVSGRLGGSRRRPYLGITVQYTTKCYLGMEEHGLEVLTVDPNSPAAAAGIQGRSGSTALGAAASTAGALVPFLGTLLSSQLEKHGDMGLAGDLIVAVDDHRVRSQDDLEDELARLKPGDTMYLTVIRQLPGGGHATKKIRVHVGQWGQSVANTGGPATE